MPLFGKNRNQEKEEQETRKQILLWLIEARVAMKAGRFNEAIPHCDKVLEVTSSSDSSRTQREAAWTLKGLCFKYTNRFEEAIVCYDKALAIRQNPLTFVYKALDEKAIGRDQEAKISMQEFNKLATAEDRKEAMDLLTRIGWPSADTQIGSEKKATESIDFINNCPDVCVICTSRSADKVDTNWINAQLALTVGTITKITDIKDAYLLLDSMKARGFGIRVISDVPQGEIGSGLIASRAKDFIQLAPNASYAEPKIVVSPDSLGDSRLLALCFFYKK